MKPYRMLLTLAFVFTALVIFGIAPTHAATNSTFTVNSTADVVDKKPGDGKCETKKNNGVCTLRAAIQETNALGGGNTIVLPAGTYRLTIGGWFEDESKKGDLDIANDLVLKGKGADSTTIDGNQLDTVIDIVKGKVVISGVTVRNGKAVSQTPLYALGGGINVGGRDGKASLKLVKSVVTGNTTDTSGGGIATRGALKVIKSRIEQNGSALGGGIFTDNGATTITDSMILYNYGSLGAGGIMASAEVKLVRSTVGYNSTDSLGGGIWVNRTPSKLLATNSSISSNTSEDNGGGIFNQGTTTLYNVTLHENMVNLGKTGAGIYSQDIGTVTLKNTLLSFNMVNGTATISDCAGIVNSNDYNLLTDTAGCTINGLTTNNIYNPIANVVTLANNGGPTWTNALAIGSYAIDAGEASGCKGELGVPLTTDQRGSVRPTDGDGNGGARCDIGAFEK